MTTNTSIVSPQFRANNIGINVNRTVTATTVKNPNWGKQITAKQVRTDLVDAIIFMKQ